MIKNLSQLKKALRADTEFEITAHCRPDYVGQRRKVTIANTQGFYSVIPDDPQSKTSLANNGRGSWLGWSNAPFWQFENGICAIYSSDKYRTEDYLLLAFRVLEKEAA